MTRAPAIVLSVAGAACLSAWLSGGASAEPVRRFAQAGSYGGTIGKQDKALSGDMEPPRAAPARGFLYPVGLDPNGDNWLALRSEPNGRGVRIRKMGPETLMTLIGQEGGWLHVRLADGESGWALGRYVACCRQP